MKKIKLIVLLSIVGTTLSYAQEKGSHLSVSLGGGLTGINYELFKNQTRNGDRDNQLGSMIVIDYTYYFNQHWGVSLGAGASYYRSKGLYPGTYRDDIFTIGTQTDNNLQNLSEYELRVRLMNWEEQQQALLIDVPLMLKYQHKLGARKRHGFFWGIGAKVQIPVWSKFNVIDGKYTDINDENNWRLNVSAYYDNSKVELGHPDKQYVHHFGTITNPNSALGWEGDMSMKLSWSGVAELGVLIGLSKRTDLAIGVYGDYGFNNIKKKSEQLIAAPENYMENANAIGETLVYSGMINSDRVERANLFSVGLKAGVKVKLGVPNAENHFLDKKTKEWEKSIYTTKDTCCGTTDTKKIEGTLERIEILMTQLYQNDTTIHYRSEESDGLNNIERDILTERVHFNLGDWKIRQEDKSILDSKADILRKNPNLRLRILGNTCDIASDQVNIPLGFNRAKAVKEYLTKKGIAAYRLIIATQSSYDPVLPNINESNRIQNRRCDFEIIVE